MLTKEKWFAVGYKVFELCYQQIIKELTFNSLSLLKYSSCLTYLEISEKPRYRGEYLSHVIFLTSCKKKNLVNNVCIFITFFISFLILEIMNWVALTRLSNSK